MWTWDQWAILILGPTAVVLSYCPQTRLRMLGPVLGLAGQVAWFYTLYVHAQWGAFIAGFAYTTSWAYGAWSLRKEYKCLFKSWIDRSISWWKSEDSTIESLGLHPIWYSTFIDYNKTVFSYKASSEKSTKPEISLGDSGRHNGS